MPKYNQGKFNPINPQKYRGNPCSIVYRSSWELNFMSRLDKDPNVLQWNSEEIIVPYIGIDNKMHRYFVDFWVKTKTQELLIEVKPNAQSRKPVKTKNTPKSNKRYIQECITYETNQRKWQAAQAVCKAKGWVWKVIGESELGLI